MTANAVPALEILNQRLRTVMHEVLANKGVLVVDDEEIVRDVMSELLSPAGYKLSIAVDLEQARRALKLDSPAVVLLDKNLPDGSGLELLKDLASMEEPAETIIMTGYASYRTVVQSMQQGVFAYLTKPFKSLDEMRVRVRAAFQRYNRSRVNELFIRELSGLLQIWLEKFRDNEAVRGILGEVDLIENEFEATMPGFRRGLVYKGAALEPVRQFGLSWRNLNADWSEDITAVRKLLRRNSYDVFIVGSESENVQAMEAIGEARKLQPDMHVTLMVTEADLDRALDAMKAGVNDILALPLGDAEVFARAQLAHAATAARNRRYRVRMNKLRALFDRALESVPHSCDTLIAVLRETTTVED